MANAELAIIIGAKDQASGVLSSVSKSAHGLGSTFGNVLKVGALGAAAGIGAVAFAAVDFLKAAAEEEAGIARLGAAVTAAGEDWAAQKDAIEKVVSAREQLAFSDDDLRSSLALLTALTGSSEEAIARQATAMDLARGAGIDLTTASKLLGKVTDENVNVLARYGIRATEGMDATELLGLVQQKFGSQSAAFASTAAGKWAILTNQIGNVKEALGAALLPVATKVFGAIGTFLTEHLDDIEKFSTNLVALAEKGFKFLGEIVQRYVIPYFKSDLIPAFKQGAEIVQTKIIPAIRAAVPFFVDLAKTALNLGKGIAQFLVPALDTLSDLWANLWPVLKEYVIPVLEKVGKFLGEHKELIIAAAGVILLLTNPWLAVAAAIVVVLAKWDEISKFFSVDVPGAIDKFLDKIGEIPIIGEIFKTMWADIVVVTTAFWEGIKIYVETAIKVVKDVIQIVTALIHGDWKEAWNGIKKLFTDVWDGITGLVGVYLDTLKGLFANRLALVSGLWGDFWAGLTAGAEALANQLANFGVKVFQWFWDLPNLMLSLGKRIIEGLWAGIQSMGDWLIDQVGALLGRIPGVSQALGLLGGSPSPFGLRIGRGLGEGVVVGLGEWQPAIRAALASTIADGGIAPIPPTAVGAPYPGHASTIAEPGGVIPAAAGEALAIWRRTEAATAALPPLITGTNKAIDVGFGNLATQGRDLSGRHLSYIVKVLADIRTSLMQPRTLQVGVLAGDRQSVDLLLSIFDQYYVRQDQLR